MSASELMAQVGQTYRSDWLTVDQPMITAFADLTHDWNFLHVDPPRAAEAGFGGTIAHGFLTISLIARLRTASDRPLFGGFKSGVNYGFEKMRLIAPVRAGSRIRGSFHVAAVSERNPGKWLEECDVTIGIEGEQRPALSARWLTLHLE